MANSTLQDRKNVFERTAQHKGVDVIYVLDCSRSMGDRLSPEVKSSKLELSKTALVSTISDSMGFAEGDRIGVISANTNIFAKPIIAVIMPLQDAGPSHSGGGIPIEKIASLKTEGGTAWAPAIRQAVKMLVEAEKRGNSQQIIILTDSKNNTSDQPIRIIPEAVKRRIKIHMVSLGNKKDREYLKLPSDLSGGEFRLVSSPSELGAHSLSPVFPPRKSEQSQKVPNDPSLEGSRVRRVDTFMTARQQSMATPPERSVTKEIELPKTFLITPKRKRAKTAEEINTAVEEIAREYAKLTADLKQGQITQAEFSEKYSICQFELQELKQSISELRAKLSREVAEYALARQRDPSDEKFHKALSDHLLKLERQVQSLRTS
jgi:hypothetical protein